MGQLMHGDEAVTYRAVITTTYPADPESLPSRPESSDESDRREQTFTHYAGPYDTTGESTSNARRGRPP